MTQSLFWHSRYFEVAVMTVAIMNPSQNNQATKNYFLNNLICLWLKEANNSIEQGSETSLGKRAIKATYF